MTVVHILGYSISADGISEDVDNAWDMMKLGARTHHVACANPHSLVIANTDLQFQRALKYADVLLPDGIGIILAAKLLRKRIRERVAGSEFFVQYSKKSQQEGEIRYFFLGSTQQVLEKLSNQLNKEFPDISVCGIYAPRFEAVFSDKQNREMVIAINRAKPDVLWVGMTAPKQEKWIENNRSTLEVPLAVSVGAVFDFYAGTKKRAPNWVQGIGLEWLPRFLREPRRLWRRNIVSTPKFLFQILLQRIKEYG